MTSRPVPPTFRGERDCPICETKTLRYYYRESRMDAASRIVGTSWFWCPRCRRYSHFSGETLSKDFTFDNPQDTTVKHERVPEDPAWYEYLNDLWERGVLPQTFTPRIDRGN